MPWNTAELADGSVTTPKLANDAVTSQKIADNAITSAQIADNAVGSSEIAGNAVNTAELADGSVTTPKLANDAVTSQKIATDAVGSSEIAANAVNTAELANDGVTEPKLASDVRTKLNADAHDSGGSATPHLAEDNRRLSRLEQLTSGLSLRTHSGWADVTNAASGAVAIVPIATFSANADDVVALTFADDVTVPANGTYAVVIRIPSGNNVNSYQIARTGSSTDPLHGVFTGGSFARAGSDYYFMAGSLSFNQNDTLQVQTVGEVLDHTVFDDEVTKLIEHEAEVFAHKDSPVRVDHLAVHAPIGRDVYLTTAVHHPGSEHIFNFDLGQLTPNDHNGQPGFVGATVIDFSGNDGPVATADTSAFPGIFNAARIAGIFENIHGTFFTVAVNKALSTDAPTHINIGFTNPGHTPTTPIRAPLTQHGADVVIGGQTYRMMRSTGVVFTDYFSSHNRNGTRPTIYFALEYPDGYIEADGSLDRGTIQQPGHYEHVALGTWKSRATAIAETIGAAELATLPAIDLLVAASGGDANDLSVGDTTTGTHLPLYLDLGSDSTATAGEYFTLQTTRRTVRMNRNGWVQVNGIVRGTVTSGNNQFGRLDVVIRRQRSSAQKDFSANASYVRRGNVASINYVVAPLNRLVPVEAGDLISIIVAGVSNNNNARPTLTASTLSMMWMGGVRGLQGIQGEPRQLLDGDQVFAAPETYAVAAAVFANGQWRRVPGNARAIDLAIDAEATRNRIVNEYTIEQDMRIGDTVFRATAAHVAGEDHVRLTFTEDFPVTFDGGSITIRDHSELVALRRLISLIRSGGIQGGEDLNPQIIRRYPQNVVCVGRFADTDLVSNLPPSAPPLRFSDDAGPFFLDSSGPWSFLDEGIPVGTDPLWRAETSVGWSGSEWRVGDYLSWIYTRTDAGEILFATNSNGAGATDVFDSDIHTHFGVIRSDGTIPSWLRIAQPPETKTNLWNLFTSFSGTQGASNTVTNRFRWSDYRRLKLEWRVYDGNNVDFYGEAYLDDLQHLRVFDGFGDPADDIGMGMLRASIGGPGMANSLSVVDARHGQGSWVTPGLATGRGLLVDIMARRNPILTGPATANQEIHSFHVFPGHGGGRIDIYGIR